MWVGPVGLMCVSGAGLKPSNPRPRIKDRILEGIGASYCDTVAGASSSLRLDPQQQQRRRCHQRPEQQDRHEVAALDSPFT